MENWNFYMPTRIRFGWGRFQEIGQIVDELNGRRIFLVTGKGFAKKVGLLDRLSDYLKGLPLKLFAEVEENPTIETVDRGTSQCRDSECDLVIGLGGGSAMDAGKAIAMLQKIRVPSESIWIRRKSAKPKAYPLLLSPPHQEQGAK